MPRPPDFDLAIVASGTGYAVQVRSAFGVGELPPQSFSLPLDLAALPRHRSDVAQWVKQARIVRLRGSEEIQQARKLGGALFEQLFAGEIMVSFRASRAALPPGERLRLRLRLPEPLTPIPWELLYDPRDNQFLALTPDLVLVRYPEMLAPSTPLRINGPLQVVAVLASPAGDDYPPIKLDRELNRIETALREPIERRQIALEVIRGPDTLGQLRARMRRPAHVLHLLCHGELDADQGEGTLIFEDADGAPEPINAELLRLQLKRESQTRVVLLNACLGALPAGEEPFSSVGAALLRGGVPAVIAMQFEIAEDTAAEMSRVFYGELAAGTPIDLALTEARQHLYARFRNRLDWAIPVLFLRADDGELFDVPSNVAGAASGTLPPLNAGDPRLLPARAAVLTQHWDEALKLYEELAAEFTLPESAATYLKQARQETWLAQISAEIQAAQVQGDWDTVVARLEQIAQRFPDNTMIAERLRQARSEQEIAIWAREAAELAQIGEWEAVTALLGKIEERRPGYTHPTVDLGSLRSQAVVPLECAAWAREATDLMDQGSWVESAALLERIEKRHPGYTHPTIDLGALRRKVEAANKRLLAQAQVSRLARDARALTDEERYPVLDSAFDEAAVTPVSLGPNYLLLGVAALVGLGLLFLLYRFLTGGGQQVAVDTTATAVRGGAGITKTIEAGPTPTLDSIDMLTPTGPLTPAPVGPPPDLANANPAPVEAGAVLEANGWSYTYPNICPQGCAAVLGPQVGSFTVQPGNIFVVVLVTLANNTGTPQPLPPDFFVLKDAQGNIYQPQPEVSSASVIRGVNAGVRMEDQVPANGVLTSLPLIFEVKSGATNLVLFARDNTDQGWMVLASVL